MMMKLKELRQNKRLSFWASIVTILLLISVVAALAVWQNKFDSPKKTAPTVKYRVSKDTTLMAVIGNLHYYGFIKDEKAFQYALEHTKDTNAGRGGAIKVNSNTIDTQAVYEISQGMNAWQMAEVLLNKGEFSDCSHGCPDSLFEPELLPGGDFAPTITEKYEWVKTYEDCVKAIGSDGGQLSSEQYYQRTGIRMCVSPDGREFTEGKEGWNKAVGG